MNEHINYLLKIDLDIREKEKEKYNDLKRLEKLERQIVDVAKCADEEENSEQKKLLKQLHCDKVYELVKLKKKLNIAN